MREVKVKKSQLVEALTKNRAEHRSIFEEAVNGYKKRALELLEIHINKVRDGSLERISISLPVPADHTQDYDRALQMLDWSLDEEIVIDDQQFAELVMDDWGWQREFLTTSSAYSMGAIRKLSS